MDEGRYQGEGASAADMVEDLSDFGHGPPNYSSQLASDSIELDEGDRSNLIGAIRSLELTIAKHCHLLNRRIRPKDGDKGERKDGGDKIRGTPMVQPRRMPHSGQCKSMVRGDKVCRSY